jgi:jumonji domain-containing protein 7
MSDSNVSKRLSELTGDYWVSGIVKTLVNPTPLELLREGVSSYMPCLLQGTINDWPATNLWDLDYLTRKIGQQKININFTSDGRADGVKRQNILGKEEPRFQYPYEEKIEFEVFADMLQNPYEIDAIPYLSEQNDNFRSIFCDPASHISLNSEVPTQFSLGESVFGTTDTAGLEAINLWIGDERSVSSLHKDHFEVFSSISCCLQ